MWMPGPLIPMALGELLWGSSAATQIGQVLLRLQCQERRQLPEDLPAVSDVEACCHSQNGEDGILRVQCGEYHRQPRGFGVRSRGAS